MDNNSFQSKRKNPYDVYIDKVIRGFLYRGAGFSFFHWREFSVYALVTLSRVAIALDIMFSLFISNYIILRIK